MLVTGIKSKPVYAPLQADARGRHHVMLGMGVGAAPLLRVIDDLRAADAALLANTRLLYVPDPETAGSGGTAGENARFKATSVGSAIAGENAHVKATAAGTGATGESARLQATMGGGNAGEIARFKATAVADVQSFDGVPALLDRFRAVLEESRMGTRLYVAGPESFIGLAMKIALDFNLNKDEIRAEECGSRARRVYCIHCRSTTESVRTNIVACIGCRRWLLVRDHYSRRLAAYMGVMVDAEAPGELPAVKEVFL